MRIVIRIATMLALNSACSTLGVDSKVAIDQSINVPFMKNEATECYYLDEYMPIPDALVKGRHGALNLRYYTYRTANYKDWNNFGLVLSFYSKDEKCWSLFEEHLIAR